MKVIIVIKRIIEFIILGYYEENKKIYLDSSRISLLDLNNFILSKFHKSMAGYEIRVYENHGASINEGSNDELLDNDFYNGFHFSLIQPSIERAVFI